MGWTCPVPGDGRRRGWFVEGGDSGARIAVAIRGVRREGDGSGRHRRRDGVFEGSQSGQNAAADRLFAEELEIVLSCVRRQLRGKPQQPEAKPLGLGPAPGAREEVFAQRVQCLVGYDGEAPQQGVAAGVVNRRPVGRELGQFLDPLLDHGALVVEAPGGQGVDAGDMSRSLRGCSRRSRRDSRPEDWEHHLGVVDGPACPSTAPLGSSRATLQRDGRTRQRTNAAGESDSRRIRVGESESVDARARAVRFFTPLLHNPA